MFTSFIMYIRPQYMHIHFPFLSHPREKANGCRGRIWQNGTRIWFNRFPFYLFFYFFLIFFWISSLNPREGKCLQKEDGMRRRFNSFPFFSSAMSDLNLNNRKILCSFDKILPAHNQPITLCCFVQL